MVTVVGFGVGKSFIGYVFEGLSFATERVDG